MKIMTRIKVMRVVLMYKINKLDKALYQVYFINHFRSLLKTIHLIHIYLILMEPNATALHLYYLFYLVKF